MPLPALSSTPAARRQNLLVEFASLKYAAPQGVYMSLSPNGPNIWWGVIFVRKGPYRGGIFKFTIDFPTNYPATAPVITFHTSIYHPLIAALTPSSETPGAFSLKHGFPHWFTTGEKALPTPGAPPGVRRETTTVEVLRYIKASLDDESVLDAIPLSACENAAAWKSWTAGEGGRGATGGWNERVKVVVEGSSSDAALFTGVPGRSGDEPIRFLDINVEAVEEVKERLKKSVEEMEGC